MLSPSRGPTQAAFDPAPEPVLVVTVGKRSGGLCRQGWRRTEVEAAVQAQLMGRYVDCQPHSARSTIAGAQSFRDSRYTATNSTCVLIPTVEWFVPEVRVPVAPRVMRWARESVGIDQRRAADKVHREVADIGAWESGSEDAPLSALVSLAALYHKPLAVFLLDEPPPTPEAPPDRRAAVGQEAAPLSADVLLAVDRARAAQRAGTELLDVLGLQAQLPGIDRSEISADVIARPVRDALGVTLQDQGRFRSPSAALARWRVAVEDWYVVVLELTMPLDEVRGFSIRDPGPPTIVLNRADSHNARIFTLFHELAHIVLGSSGLCTPQQGLRLPRIVGYRNSLERFCNDIAGAVLIPEAAMREDKIARQIATLGKPPDDALLYRAAVHFRVSKFVLWYRLRALGMVSDAVFRAKWAQWPRAQPDLPRPSSGGGGAGMTRAERSVIENGSGFASLVLSAQAEGLVTASRALDYLGVQLGDMEAVAAYARGT